jgi:hypothetical protein
MNSLLMNVSRSDEESRRELRQLWYVSEMYLSLAQTEKKQISQDSLKWTIKDLASKCDSNQGLKENENLIRAVAHLVSSAVRLYAIEECVGSKRYKAYNRIIGRHNSSEISQEIEGSLHCYIHFLLRHMVAHSETRWKKDRNHEIAFKTMNDIYWKMNFTTIFEKIESAKYSLKSEIEEMLDDTAK